MAHDIPRNKYTRVPSKERRTMVKGKVSFDAPEDDITLKPAAQITKQPTRSKLSSTDRRDLLATSRERTHSKAKTSGSRSASWKENADCGTKQRVVQMSTASGSPNNHPGFPTQSVPGSLKHTSRAEDRPTQQVTPSSSSKSRLHLKTLDDDRERVETSLNREEGTQLIYANAVEDRLEKQVIPSGDRKSSPHPALPRKSSNTGFYSSSKSEKQNDRCERVHLPWSDKEGPRKKLMHNDGPVNTISAIKEVKASSSTIERPANSSTSSVPIKPVPKSDSVCSNLADACLSNQESQKRKSSKALHDSLKYPQNGPALQTIWKGAFEVINLSQGLGFCERLIAHPSAKVSAKAYKFTEQMTGVLKFKSVSRSELWPELFEIRSPDWNDIALYFYPDKSDSSYKQKYSGLLKYMVKNDILLRSRMGHVELLCFASNTLALDCRELSGNYYMWGVFRRLKGNTTTRDMVRGSRR